MTTADTRGKLFAAFARRLDAIDDVQLEAAVVAWQRDRSRSLSDLLIARGAIGVKTRALVEEIVAVHLAAHGGDLEACYRAIADKGWVPAVLVADIPPPPPDDNSPPPTAAPNDPGAAAGVAGQVGADDVTETVTLGSYASGGSRYELVEFITRGGMGEVWLARDLELNRTVLLKQVLPKYAQNPESRANFLRETRTGANLEHPGIVPVYDIGQHPGGQLFQVMRYFRPGSLHKKIASYHLAHPESIDELAFRAILGHFATACRAIDYVHSRGIHHLDIKPQNIVTGDFGETQIIDWGLARVTDGDMLVKVTTESGRLGSGSSPGERSEEKPPAVEVMPRGLRGTPSYAAPEQWRGNAAAIGAHSDVYGLGATLFEILAGKAPFIHPSPTIQEDVEIGNVHREMRPWAPLPLRAICRKAMAVKPADRYASVGALADDIDRYLADEPVAAWPDPWHVRAWRFVKRHRTAVAAASALLATTAVALGVGNVLVARQRDRAVRNARMARQVIQELNVEIGDDFWSTIPQADERRLFMMNKAVGHYRQLVRDHPDDRGILTESADAMRRLANLSRATGKLDEAIELYRETLALQEHLPRRSESEWRDRIDTEIDRAGAILASAGIEAAIPWQERAWQLAEDFSSKFPDSELASSVLARVTADLASSYAKNNENDKANPLFDVSVEWYGRISSGGSPTRDDVILAAAALTEAARHYRGTGEAQKAKKISSWAMASAESLLKMASDDPNHRLLMALAAREQALADLPPPAESALEPMISSLGAITEEHPAIDGFKVVLAETLIDDADLRLTHGDFDGALHSAAKAADTLAPVSGKDSRELRANAMLRHGRAALMAGDKHTAQVSLRSAAVLCHDESGGFPSRAMEALRATIDSELETSLK